MGSKRISVKAIHLGVFDYFERGSPGIDIPEMIKYKIDLALEFKAAKLFEKNLRNN